MRFERLSLPGAWLIRPQEHKDHRGSFRRHFCAEEFAAHGLDARVRQCNVSENYRKHTLRGLHWQEGPHAEAKTLSCFLGAALFQVVDLRPDSPAYLTHVRAQVTEYNRVALHVPAGCACAFLSLTNNTVLHYYVSASYCEDAYRGARYNDPALGLTWPCEPEVISPRDLGWPDFVPAAVPGKRGEPCASS